MPVIKGHIANRIVEKAVILDLGDLKRQGELFIEQARHSAAAITKDAERKAEKLLKDTKEEAFREGYADGHTAGFAQGENDGREAFEEKTAPRVDAMIESWKAAIDEWDEARKQFEFEAQEEILTFSFELARRIVHATIDRDPSVIRRQMEAAIRVLVKPTDLVIEVHPEDEELMHEYMPSLLEKCGSSASASLRAADSVKRGGCMIHADGGKVDATIETQLRRIMEGLFGPESQDQLRSMRALENDDVQTPDGDDA